MPSEAPASWRWWAGRPEGMRRSAAPSPRASAQLLVCVETERIQYERLGHTSSALVQATRRRIALFRTDPGFGAAQRAPERKQFAEHARRDATAPMRWRNRQLVDKELRRLVGMHVVDG